MAEMGRPWDFDNLGGAVGCVATLVAMVENSSVYEYWDENNWRIPVHHCIAVRCAFLLEILFQNWSRVNPRQMWIAQHAFSCQQFFCYIICCYQQF